MTAYVTHGLIISFIYFQLAVLMIILSNIVILRRTRRYSQQTDYPVVSILVPARNEENSVRECIQSLLGQDYPNFEVIVLDDQSTDRTPDILAQIAESAPGLKVIAGDPAPEGFCGKNWACAQLATQAHGDLLLFTDADTVFQPSALRQIVSRFLYERADLLSGYPRQRLGSWGERLLVPFFLWAVYCFIPLWLAYRLRLPLLSSAVGQMMIFDRRAYEKIGGHTNLGAVIVEDIALARNTQAAGLRLRVMNITHLVSCRMYQGSREAFDGFAKNLFAFFDFHFLPYLFVYIWLGMMFLWPWIILAGKMLGFAPTASYTELLICMGLSMLVWCIPYVALRLPGLLGLIYPITMLANEAAAVQSLVFSLTGRLSWKGRPLAKPKWKWL